jgi:hypothetical protein
MMRLAAGFLIIGAASALAACGSERSGTFTTKDGDSAEYTIDEKSGETRMTLDGPDGTATLRSGKTVPLSLPAGFSLYPGARVVTNTLVKRPDGEGVMVMFETPDTPQAVIAHYRREAEASGIALSVAMTTERSEMIGGEREDRSLTFSATANAQPDKPTAVQLIIGSGKPRR